MEEHSLEGTELPAGEFSIEDWKGHLWADATRNPHDAFRYDEAACEAGEPGQLVPHTMCQHIVYEATGGIEATMNRLTENWRSEAALGGLRVTFHRPLTTETMFLVTGEITNVAEKVGESGPLTIVTHAYEVVSEEDKLIYELEADILLFGGT